MAKKKKSATTKNSVSESPGLAADTANASPTPGSSTPAPESRASTTAPVEPPQPQLAPDSDGVQTNGTDQPEDLKTRADALKDQGNVFFKSKDYAKAVGLYTEAIREFGH